MNLVIFDFDGVIVQSETKKFRIVQTLLKNRNVELPDDTFPEFIGKKRGFFIKEKFPNLKNSNELLEEIREMDQNLDFELMPGFIQFIDFLKQENYTLAIATGSNEKIVNKVLNRYGIKSYFSRIITGDQVEESKPNPAIFHKVLDYFPEHDACIIEDSPAGITAAEKTSAKVIGFGKYSSAAIYYENFEDLLNYFQTLKV